MTIASLVSIGDEVLSGDILNTNSRWLAQRLGERGVRVVRMLTIPDEVETIAQALRGETADAVIVTGGLGATHDDVTREGVARAFNLPLERHPEAEAHLRRLFPPGRFLEQNLAMADLPRGCEVIPNPVGAAPGFIIGRVHVLPGVPREMEAMFTLIAHRFTGEAWSTGWLVTPRFEVEIGDTLRECLREFPGLKLGSYPTQLEEGGRRRYIVKVKLEARDPLLLQRAQEWLAPRIRGTRG
ncbi:MAG: competence/damage-inducible protein A [Euryarchaeota archaeon]|nr:competence/damage-inducible protein A [Euryarchaeota archaeon]